MLKRGLAIALFTLAVAVSSHGGEAEDAKAAFENAYELGAAAAIEKKWTVAEKNFEAALKALGEHAHPKKAVAQVLLNKARDAAKPEAAQQEALATADELLKLKQWPEALAAYRKAAETLGETDAIKKGIEAAHAGHDAEIDAANPALKAEREKKAKFEALIADAAMFVKEGKMAEAAQALNEADVIKPKSQEAMTLRVAMDEYMSKTAHFTERVAKGTTKVEKNEEKGPEPLEVPAPIALDRDQWLRGAGSSCYWEAERLHLEEGDEYFKKILTKDFAASIAIEAQMDHRSLISIELRPTKESGVRAKIVGWGSKEGSAPMLAVDKDIKARAEKQPPQEQITLSFVRTGRKIEFYCDGQLIGHTWSEKLDQPYYLWVCGKGIMNGAKVVER